MEAGPKNTGGKRCPAFAAQMGKGRPKGAPNKSTTLLKDAIIQAATKAGGGDIVEYLASQARTNPQSFLPLLGKVLPLQVTGADGGPIAITRIELVAVEPKVIDA